MNVTDIIIRPAAACSLLLAICFVLLLPHSPGSAEASHQHARILFLSSYHQGEPWTDRIIAGFSREIEKVVSSELFVEYLDTRRRKPRESNDFMRQYLQRKYRDTPFDLIVCSDDPALDFLLAQRKELFTDIPVIFCGINNFTPARLAGEKAITGVDESPDIKGTIELLLALQPKTKTLAVIGATSSSTHKANLEHYNQAIDEFKDRLRSIQHINLAADQIQKVIADLPDDAAVLMMSVLFDTEGKEMPLVESAAIVAEAAQVPTYCLWDFQLETGALGGSVVSGTYQGQTAAGLARKILGGEPVERLPVMASPNHAIVDWQAISRFILSPEDIPSDATIINRHLSFWQQYRNWLLGIALFCGLQTSLIALLISSRSRHKKAEAALGESERHYRIIFENSPVGMNLFDAQGILRDCNDKFIELMGASRQKIIGFNTAKESSEEMRQTIQKALQGEMSIFEGPYTSKTGGVTRDLQVIFNPVNPGQSPTEVIATVKDISERRQAEKERQALEVRLRQAQKMEAIGTLAGGIAHDFNNILGAILGYAELAREGCPTGSSITGDIDQVLKAGTRAGELVKQILAFSRQAEADRVLLMPAESIGEAVKLLRPSLPSTIDIRQDIDPKAGPVLADPTQLQQILVNLCTNAYHAMEETGGTLAISLKRLILSSEDLAHKPGITPGAYIQLSISDTGPGMSMEIQEKIFDPYFTTKDQGKGTGMGLAIVHGIIKSYDGHVSCYSQVGEGTVFHVFLPVVSGESAAEKNTVEAVPVGSNEHILFIDDEEILAELAKTMLERLGYTVTVKNSSFEALASFQNQPELFDLVITDQTMPGMTGIDLARRMLRIRPDLPIILCTGFSNLVSKEKAQALGIREFALKPLTRRDIAGLISKVLER